MSSPSYDIVTVGGGLAASAFAASVASKGLRVLLLEKELQFKDRVRGEYIGTWGVKEAQELGIQNTLLTSGATEIPFVEMGFGLRNLVETTSQRLPFFTRQCKKPCSGKRSAPAPKCGAA
jgi:2-polyprenyl-6-methoxyphenol hydroxylase-like FAD-dependent oxidoreductase